MQERYVITITRQFGSLGRPIAREMAKMLDIDYYDRDIVEMAAKEMQQPANRLCVVLARSNEPHVALSPAHAATLPTAPCSPPPETNPDGLPPMQLSDLHPSPGSGHWR